MARHVTPGFTRAYWIPKEELRCTATLPDGNRCNKRRAVSNDLYCHLHAHLESK